MAYVKGIYNHNLQLRSLLVVATTFNRVTIVTYDRKLGITYALP
jgi:hypothetical protein